MDSSSDPESRRHPRESEATDAIRFAEATVLAGRDAFEYARQVTRQTLRGDLTDAEAVTLMIARSRTISGHAKACNRSRRHLS